MRRAHTLAACIATSLVLVSVMAQASVYYVDNTCGLDGDGSVGTCAASNGSPGALNELPLVISLNGQNTYLIKRGTIIDKQGHNQVTNITGSGASVDAPLTIGAYGVGNRPVLRASMRAILITAPAKFVRLESLEFSDMALTLNGSSAVILSHAVTDDAYVTFSDVVVRNITDASGGATGQDCLLLKGRHNTVINSNISHCAQDGIQFYGDYFTAIGNTISHVSEGDLFGDTIQGSTDANYFYIANNILDHSMNAAKQGFVLADAGVRSDVGGGVFWGNTIIMGAGPVASYCIYTEQPNSIYSHNTCTHSGTRHDSPGIVVSSYASGTMLVGNLVRMLAGGSNGIDLGASSVWASQNTVMRTTAPSGHGLTGGAGRTAWKAHGNIVSGFAVGLSHENSPNYEDKNNALLFNAVACADHVGVARTCDASTMIRQ